MCKRISWSRLFEHRRAAAKRFGRIFDLPIRKRASDIVVREAHDLTRVLEIGAGDRRFREHLRRHEPALKYHSLDIDRAVEHDYHELDEVTEIFPLVFALEVVEHLSLEEIEPWLTQIRGVLEPDGRLILSTPNTYYPPAYLRDATHRTPLCYDELAGLLAAAGYEVLAIYRIYHDPLHRRFLRRYMFGWLFRLIGIDFARQIVVVARNSTPEQPAYQA